MSLHNELTMVLEEGLRSRYAYKQPTATAELVEQLKGMRNGAKAELCEALFQSMNKQERTQTLVKLSDAVNK